MTCPTPARALLLALALLPACGDDDAPADDAAAGPDAIPGPDATPPADAYIADAVVSSCTPQAGGTIGLDLVATAGDAVLLITAPAGDARQFIVERDGIVRTMRDGVLSSSPFLDLRNNIGGPVVGGGERGLLGLAFHPDYANNQRLFVFYTAEVGGDESNVVAEYRATAVDEADPATGRVVLSIPDFATNHNGGMIEFGDDGYLYIATGDGGGGGDPGESGQDPNELLGKMLRIDVDAPAAGMRYGIPLGNPFAVAGGGAPEIFQLGLRNPWRWSFDRTAGAMYIGDVGQNTTEELNRVLVADGAGVNFGWDQYEGDDCFEAPCDPAGKTFPILTRTQGDGYCSIIAGQVYRGVCFPDLAGRFFYTDYCGGELESFVWADDVTDEQVHQDLFHPTTMYADALGELYVANEDGEIYRIVATP